mgnify:CR=1 FL=1
MRFSQQFIDEIKDRNPIEEVVSRYVPLKRAGSNLVGICPFHNEKSPSFTVFPATKSYYCFGCGAGGDIFGFVMQTEGLDYPSAVETLAELGLEPGRDVALASHCNFPMTGTQYPNADYFAYSARDVLETAFNLLKHAENGTVALIRPKSLAELQNQ